MTTYLLRVWVPDRPGALGAVASRIGAVRGDLIGIDILERGAGRAIDELVVQLPDDNGDLVPLLIAEVSQVDGVDVEDVRPVSDVVDHRLDALETAALLVEQSTTETLLSTLAEHAAIDFEAEWAAVAGEGGVGAVVGEAPSAEWIAAFVEGSRSSQSVASFDTGPDDTAWAPLPGSGLGLVIGRRGRPFRARERRQLGALARIADHRLMHLR
ncbi:MAG TPA: hypothetical protein VM938_15110 [Acidimicrobiales bacterium]|nr:hypothetical protein [Acidimicrobiales bacterium]